MKGFKKTGIVLAGVAATLLASGFVTSAVAKEGMKEVKCSGVNACKGHSSCKGAENACKGQNKCKGAGFVVMSAGACEQVGGKVEK